MRHREFFDKFAMQLGKTHFAHSATLHVFEGGEASGLRSWPIKKIVLQLVERGLLFISQCGSVAA